MPEKFAELTEHFVLVKADTKNGSSKVSKRLLVQRNATYFLFLDESGREFYRMVDPGNGRKKNEGGRPIRWNTAIARMEEAVASPPQGKEGSDLLRELLTCDDPHLRSGAAGHVAQLGDAGATLVPDLIKALEDKDTRRTAVRALGAIGPKAKAALPALLDLLKTDRVHGQAAAMALGQIDRNGGTALQVLVPLLKSGTDSMRIGAVIGLGSIGPNAAIAVNDLIPLLDARSVALKYYTIKTLGRIGPAAAKTKEKLRELAKTRGRSSLDTQRAAREALKQIEIEK